MNLADNIISFFSPKLALERQKLRSQLKVVKSATRSYDGATRGRRGDGWNVGSSGNNQNLDIQWNLLKLRERSIDGYKNNSTVFKAIRTIQNNVIGTGIMPTPTAVVGDKPLTKTEITLVASESPW